MRLNTLSAKRILILAAVVSGCSNPFGGGASEVDANHHPGIDDSTVLTSTQTAELVPSSAQLTPTASGHYKISGSISGLSNQVKVTTSHGYQLFSSVQGQIISNGQGL